jgi:hypothetical protein
MTLSKLEEARLVSIFEIIKRVFITIDGHAPDFSVDRLENAWLVIMTHPDGVTFTIEMLDAMRYQLGRIDVVITGISSGMVKNQIGLILHDKIDADKLT